MAIKALEFREKKHKIRAITLLKVIQGHRESVSIESPYATSY